MRKLSTNQLDFLVEKFFYVESVAGSAQIARQLLQNGHCVVAGGGRVWYGGVGNFLTAVPAKDAVGCTHLSIDVDEFLSSVWAQQELSDREQTLRKKIRELQDSLAALRRLMRK